MSRFLLLLFRGSYASQRGYRTSLNLYATPGPQLHSSHSHFPNVPIKPWYHKPSLSNLASIATRSLIPRAAPLLSQLPQFTGVAHWGARIFQRGDGDEEEEGEGGSGLWCRGGERGDNLSPADEVCTTEDDQLRQDNARAQERESGTSPLHRRGTSGDSDEVSQACSTLRAYNIKKFYIVVTNGLLSRLECRVNFSPDSIMRIHAVAHFPLYMSDSRSNSSRLPMWLIQTRIYKIIGKQHSPQCLEEIIIFFSQFGSSN